MAGQLPERSRLRPRAGAQPALGAGVRWGYIGRNPACSPGRNRQPPPRPVRTYSRAELDAIAAELHPACAPLPVFAAGTGLRPEEWQALERARRRPRARVLTVVRTVSGGALVELGKTSGSRRQVPLSQRALAALEAIPPRLDTPLIFPAPHGGRVEPQQLAPPRVGARDRGGRDHHAREDLRPQEHVRQRRARRRGARVHAREGDGHVRAHDREVTTARCSTAPVSRSPTSSTRLTPSVTTPRSQTPDERTADAAPLGGLLGRLSEALDGQRRLRPPGAGGRMDPRTR